MSYTPDSQMLRGPLLESSSALEAADASLGELRKPMMERLKNPQGWASAHLDELQVHLRAMSELEVSIRSMVTKLTVLRGDVGA